MKKLTEGEIIDVPMVVTDISETEHGTQYTMTYTETDTEYSMTIDDWALEGLSLYSQKQEEDWYEQLEQVKFIISSKISIAEDKINEFIKECHENRIDILSIEPLIGFTSLGDPNKRLDGAIQVGVMIRYLAPLYETAPIDDEQE